MEMREKWMVSMKKPSGRTFDEMAGKYGIKSITARLLVNRGLVDDADIEMYLHGGESMLHDPKEIADMEKGAAVMKNEIERGAKIRVIGDYDVDGICSSFILVKGLQLFGGDVDYVLPDRVKDGYGLSIKLVDQAIADGKDCIITCDNGIAAAEQIAHAKEQGMTVVVTDHHEVPFEKASDDSGEKKELLPPADAVIDPKRAEGSCSFREICGAVVAYKFLQVLAEKMELSQKAQVRDFFYEMMIFAGLATVCDVMELKNENRVIVKESLRRIRDTKNLGLKALMNVNSLEPDKINAYHYGFVIGPCLNATGRIDLASRAMDLFLEKNEAVAATMAKDLKDMNDSRKDLTQKGVEEAAGIVLKELENGTLPKVLVIYLPKTHESIAGIIAGRIREKFGRPTIILTKADDGGAKGSGRSVEKYDMFSALSQCKELFSKFGGHKMAAGMSLPEENIDELRRRLNENCELTEDDFVPVIHIDMQLPFQYATMDLIKEFALLEPFGNGNKKPLFAQKDVRILRGSILGKNKNCGKYRVIDESGKECDMMYFGDMDSWHEFLRERFGQSAIDRIYDREGDGSVSIKIAYYPDINSYKGTESLQLIMESFS